MPKLRPGGPSVRAGQLMARRRAVGPGVSIRLICPGLREPGAPSRRRLAARGPAKTSAQAQRAAEGQAAKTAGRARSPAGRGL